MWNPLTFGNWLRVLSLALLATVGTYYERNYPIPSWLEPIAGVADNIQLPASLLSALISGNYHAPPAALQYALLFLTYVLLLGVFAFLVQRIGRPSDA